MTSLQGRAKTRKSEQKHWGLMSEARGRSEAAGRVPPGSVT